MSTNARTWFYEQPEKSLYLITERLNGTFWQARIVGMYWRCVQVEPHYRAIGYAGNRLLELAWVPGQWLSLKAPHGFDIDPLVEAVTQRVLGRPPCVTYATHDNEQVFEWHVDGGDKRWSEIQGRGEFVRPRRLPCAGKL